MVSHDCVAFYLLSQEVAKSVKVVQSGQGADEVLGGYDWYPPLASVPREDAVEAYSRRLLRSPVAGPRRAARIRTGWPSTDEPTAFITERFGRPGAETSVDAALRNDTTIMLVDDPVKRVDNMTMAAGLEARVPFLDHELVELAGRIPPELKLADGGKGVLKRAARGVVPDEVIDRTKGYFPVPAIRQLEGPYLERVRAALLDPAARPGEGCSARRRWRRCWPIRTPPGPPWARTRCGSSRCWRCGCSTMGSSLDEPTGEPRPRTLAGAGLVEAWGSWCPTLSPHAEQMAFLSDRNGSPQVFVSDLRMDGSVDRAAADHPERGPGRLGQLVRRRRLAGLRGGHRRRSTDPGVGGPTRRP